MVDSQHLSFPAPSSGDRFPVISVVVPVFNEAASLPELCARLDAVFDTDRVWRVIVVNDGSDDGTGNRLAELGQRYAWLSVIHLSRNFGHQVAITAGLDHAEGEAVIIMDGDLQDPPEIIPQLLAKWQEGYDVVFATRRTRAGEGWFKRASAKLFYRLLGKMTPFEIPHDTGDYRLINRRMLLNLKQLREQNRFLRGMISWAGFRQAAVFYDREERFGGKPKYRLGHMVRFATVGVFSFSKVPLQWISCLGFLISLVSFIGIVWVCCLKITGAAYLVRGWPSLMLTMLLLGGIQLICLGTIGEYVGMIFDEVRRRPLYLVDRLEGRLAKHPPQS